MLTITNHSIFQIHILKIINVTQFAFISRNIAYVYYCVRFTENGWEMNKALPKGTYSDHKPGSLLF